MLELWEPFEKRFLLKIVKDVVLELLEIELPWRR